MKERRPGLRPCLYATVGLLLAGWTLTTRAQSPPAPPVMQAREALGGDAALAAVSAFSARGSVIRRGAGAGSDNMRTGLDGYELEVAVALPGRFVMIERARNADAPSLYEGYANGTPIAAIKQPNAPRPQWVGYPNSARTLTLAEARAARMLEARRKAFVVMLPLFGGSHPDIQGSRESGPVRVGKTTFDAVDLADSGGNVWRMFFDQKTHLPARLTWRAKPALYFLIATFRDSMSLPEVEWAITISDYKAVAGFRWPHRFALAVDGRPMEELRVSSYEPNAQLPASTFVFPSEP